VPKFFSKDSSMYQPLKGVRVVDLSQVLAGPYATYQLALLGAEVLKIEKPGEGDWTRHGGGTSRLSKANMGLGFMTQNAGKKSITIDLKKPDGLALVKKLIATADVFVENFKPGVAERLGLGFDVVSELAPSIVYCSISAYGQDGPLRERPAYDHVIQGMCGIMMTTGQPDAGPTKVGAPYVDYATGMNAAMAIMSGLLDVKRTGAAVRLDVAMLDTALMLMASLMTQHLSTDWKPAQNGNEAWSASPSSGAFDTADGVLMLAANNDVQFGRLCWGLDRPDMLEDPRWGSPEQRALNGAELRLELISIFGSKTAAHWEEVLSNHQVPAARVRGLDEVLAEEQVHARGLMTSFTVPEHDRPIQVPTMSFKANGTNTPPQSIPSRLGADTDHALTDIGLTAAEIESYRLNGVL
jgi:crotonobetainyl-CoA:carnitine CoA-transferase CaiB-like acyl-CoA transferase